MRLKRMSNNDSIDSMHNGAFSELAALFRNEHYDLSVDEDCNLTVIATKDKSFMPTIEITTEFNNGKYMYSPVLTFPVLDYADMQYYDDIEHWTNRWHSIGLLMSHLVDFAYVPSDWTDEE